MKYISIDIETTGKNPETCQILEIAAVADDLKNTQSFEQLRANAFHCYVSHEQIVGEPFALSMHSRILRILGEENRELRSQHNIIHPNKVVTEFNRWLRRLGDSPYTFAGKNFANFDLQFLKRLPKWSSLIHMRRRIVDPAILFMTLDDPAPPSLDECLRRAGIDLPVTHQALDDALAVCVALRRKFHPREQL